MTELHTLARGDPRVAIVDDDEDIRQALAALVAGEGYVPETFETGEALLTSNRLDQFACVVTDLQMPSMNGLALAREIGRKHPLPIILITAFPSLGLQGQAAAVGITCILRKPFDPSELVKQLAKLVVNP